MPYSTDHKKRTRQRILESAHRLFSSKGFEATSIETIMHDCKLTRGGFYAHFRSKAQLYHEAMGSTAPRRSFSSLAINEMSARWLDAMLASCLRPAQSGDGGGSHWAFLATDAVSKQPEVRTAYAQAFKVMSQRLCQELEQSSHGDRAALVLMALAVGALAVAMTVDDTGLRSSLVSACREHAKALFESADKRDRLDFFWTAEARDGAHAIPARPRVH